MTMLTELYNEALLVDAVGIAAMGSLVVWAYQRLKALREGCLPIAHTWYMLSHFPSSRSVT